MSRANQPGAGAERRLPWVFRPGGGFVVLRSWWGVVAIVAMAAAIGGLSPVSIGAWWLLTRAGLVVLALVVWEAVVWRCERYTLSPTHAVWESGVFRRLRVEMALERVQNTVVYRSLGERVLGLGTIGIACAGTDGYEVVWRSVARPHEVVGVLRGAIARAGGAPLDVTRVGEGAAVPGPKHVRPEASWVPVIGLAGGVGSGKSTVAAIMGELGCLVIDSDQRVRAALDRSEVREKLVEWWGREILGEDGRVDRGKVAKIVFADAEQRVRLEGLVHPIVRQDRAAMIAEAEGAAQAGGVRHRAVVIDAPLLFEAGLDRECDAVIFVDAPRAERLKRVREARGWDEQELDRREAAQMPLEEKRARSTRVVSNTGEPVALRAAVAEALEALAGAGRK